MKLSVCIATFRRCERLELVVLDMQTQTRVPDQVVIVDNDASASARAVIERLRSRGMPFELLYDVQPQRNIALTRNRTVEMANGDWLAFIDDDERAPSKWLESLLAASERYRADGVLAPVEPRLPDCAPAWIRRGRFYDFPRLRSGAEVPYNRMRFGNVLLRGDPLRAIPGPFDPAYGLSTGEDGDLLVRMARAGSKIVWCDEACICEPVETKRLSLRWLLARAMSGGQEFARQTVSGKYGPISALGCMVFFSRCLAQLAVAALLAMLSWPTGRHRAAQWLITASANAGKISAFWGWRYRAYA